MFLVYTCPVCQADGKVIILSMSYFFAYNSSRPVKTFTWYVLQWLVTVNTRQASMSCAVLLNDD